MRVLVIALALLGASLILGPASNAATYVDDSAPQVSSRTLQPATESTPATTDHARPATAPRAGPVSAAATGVAAEAGTGLIGRSYGLGTVVENPGLTIKGFQGSKTPGHALNMIINRGVSPQMLRDTVANPRAVLHQGSGNYLHLSDEAVVVLRPDGQVVTAYGRADFRPHVLKILEDLG